MVDDRRSYDGLISYGTWSGIDIRWAPPQTTIATQSFAIAPSAVSASTGVSPMETSYSLYGHIVPLSVFGVGRIGGEIISGPWVENGLASFIISFGVPADPTGTRDLREIAFDSEVVWTVAGGFTTEAFDYRFYGGTLTQAADTLETTHFGVNAVAYRGQMLLAFSNLPLANMKFGRIPYVAAVIGDASGDDVNLGEAFERLAYGPYVGYTSDEFETVDITDGLVSGGLIIAQDTEFLQLIQQFGRFYSSWDILQTDKLRVVDRGAVVTADINLDTTRLIDKVAVNRLGQDGVRKDLELSTIDPDADYTIVPSLAQRPRDPVSVTTSVGKDTAYLPAIMDSFTRMATVTLTRYYEEATRKTITGTAMAYGLEIEPGALVAIVNLSDDFTDEVFKVVETLHGANYTVEFTATSILRCSIGNDTDLLVGQVVLLLSFDGVDGSITFTDESPAEHGDAVVNANAQVDTAFQKFGTGSGLFNGVGGGLFTPNDALLYSISDDWNFGSGEFTVEAWIRPTSVTGTRFIVGCWGISNLFWVLYQNGSQLSWADSTDGSTISGFNPAGGTLVTNTWQAVCADYDGTKLRIYIDGVMVGSESGVRTIAATNKPLAIGVNSDLTAFCFNGNMDELRITKGVARYASDSGYTVPIAAFPRD